MAKNLSIIIPTYNESINIQKLIDFLWKNTKKGQIEIIVVDSTKSTDNTAAIAESMGALVLRSHVSQRAYQMNLGATQATTGILYFIHADVIPPPSFYIDIITAINQKAAYGMFSYHFDTDQTLLKINAFFTRYLNMASGGGDQTLFISKSAFDSLQGFDSNLIIMEDFDLYRRAQKLKLNIVLIKNDAIVSARKYLLNSYLKVNMINFITLTLWRLGYPQARLALFYKRWIKK